MKLHHLRFEGIGPFKDPVSLDFAALGASGLFLLEGATGSGKSTIIDALVFALYGNVAGEGSSGDRIRSHFMPGAKESFVDLFFEVPDGLYRIRRTPAYMRPKQRGEGFTRHNATAKLWKLASPDALDAAIAGTETVAQIDPIASRIDDVGAQIARIIGLTHDQLTQTVVLPQGEFARFLRAETKDRKKVLERVFGTHLYDAIEDQFAKVRQAANRDVAASQSRLEAGMERVLEAAAVDDARRAQIAEDCAGYRPVQVERASAHVKDLEADAATRKKAAAQEENACGAALDKAVARSEKAGALSALLARRRELDARMARRDALAPTAASARAALALHEAVEQAFYALRDRDTAAAALAEARAHVSADLREHPERWAAAQAKAAAAAETNAREAAELEALVSLEKDLPRRAAALDAARTEAAAALRAKETAGAAVADRPRERAVLGERQAALATQARPLDAERAHLSAATARVSAARTAHALAGRLAASTAAAGAAITEARAALDHETSLRTRRMNAMAAELALDLSPGDPCAVCGATEHPAPATASSALVTGEQIAAAERVRQAKERAASERERECGVLQAELTAARRAATETAPSADASDAAISADSVRGADSVSDTDPVTGTATDDPAPSDQDLVARAEAQRAHHEAAVRAAEHATVELEGVERAIAQFDDATAALQVAFTAAQVAHERAATTVEALAKDQEDARQRVECARHPGDHDGAPGTLDIQVDQDSQDAQEGEAGAGFATVQERQKYLRDTARAQNQQATALATALRAQADHESLAAAAAALVASSDLDTDVAVREARRSADERAALSAAVTEHASLSAQIAEAAEDPALAEFTADEDRAAQIAEEAEAAEAALVAARAALAEAGELRAWRDRLHDRTAAAALAFAQVVARHNATSARQAEVVHLANIATGNSSDTSARLTLSTFAVMQRFGSVVQAANARLATLSGTDLELVLSDLAGPRNRQVGLGLDVMDRRTDTARDPRTLSGGETFFVSLALALGLADIVSAESGGVHMNTLFIDEGFGSLDPEKLDGVIAEIRQLAQHGRTVGIVSHVAELKNQISEKIHVQRTASGTSTARLTVD